MSRNATNISRHHNHRNAPDTDRRCWTREASLTPATLDADARRIQSVLTTADPALVYDWSTGRVILEVLLMSGAEHESQTPLLRDHIQYSVTSILGSVTEHSTKADELLGWLTFGKDLDETAEAIWRRVEQGHLRRVSIGYDYSRDDYVTIEAGQTATVKGRSFTAPKDSALRVVIRWRLREVSVVVIPADSRAQMRDEPPEDTRGTLVNPASQLSDPGPGFFPEGDMKRYLQWLHRNGLSASVTTETEALAWARSGNLTASQLTEFAEVCHADSIAFDAASATVRDESTSGNVRSQTLPNPAPASPTTLPVVDAQRVAAEAIAAERARTAAISQLGLDFPEVPRDTVQRAHAEGWDLDRTRNEFLAALRSSRQPGAPAIHSRGGGLTREVLQAALLSRFGIHPDSPVMTSTPAYTLASRSDLNIGWALHCPQRGERRDRLEQAFDQVHQLGLRNATMMRVCEELIRMNGDAVPYNQEEILQRAFATANFSAVFGAVVHMMLWSGYASTPASYTQFCEVVDVPDLKDNSEAMMGEVGRLQKQAKVPGPAKLLNLTDPVIATLAASRHSGQLKVTDQTIINDSFGVTGVIPTKMGQMIQGYISDIVYSQLMDTGNLIDGRARFNITDGNLISSGALTVAGLTAMEVALRAKKVGDRRIQLGRTVLICGLTLGPTARVLQGQTPQVTVENPFAGTFDVVEDTAIDIGVLNPDTIPETAIAGTPTAYYALTADGNSIKVAFRQGTNRGPVTRTAQLDKGEWGVCWDVFVDVGAAFMRRTGAVKVITA